MNIKEKRINRNMELALQIAEATPVFGAAKVGAVLTYKNEVISVGFNSDKKHTVATIYSRNKEAIYPHAEIMAIHNASKKLDIKDFRHCTLYVARVKRESAKSKGFVKGMAKPCSGCEKAIKAFGIKRVYWTTDNGEIDTDA
jgi:tRNA(Arg) A34 adenosine deaminase TadA